MRNLSSHTAFNARFLSPEQVALSFVPTHQFVDLLKVGHSIVMGPRGSGKTTLLKMLTRSALERWNYEAEKKQNETRFQTDYEAIYIPSDARWLEEIKLEDKVEEDEKKFVESIQRLLISLSVIKEWCATMASLLDEDEDEYYQVAKELVRAFSLEQCVPHFSEIDLELNRKAAKLRGLLNWPFRDALQKLLQETPEVFFAGPLDCSVICCDCFERFSRLPRRKWALCFDELEISPDWLQSMLISSLRSIDERFLLKLTWSPVLPTLCRTNPEDTQDFETVRLWYSHVADASGFCRMLSRGVLRDIFKRDDLEVDDILGLSAFAERDDDPYGREGDSYRLIKSLAESDQSLRGLLIKNGIDPEDPFAPPGPKRDAVLRKIKPTAVLRSAFLGDAGRARSRKSSAIVYKGSDVVFAMSEGNPRRLINILYRLVAPTSLSSGEAHPSVKPNVQARLLSSFSNQFKSYLKSIPSASTSNLSLFSMVEAISRSFSLKIYGSEFLIDPPGSFVVDEDDEGIVSLIREGLEKGAFIYIGDSTRDVAQRIVGERFRVTYMLSPAYKLPLRNNVSASLSSCLTSLGDPRQPDFFG